ncbi:glycosyltransferase family 8 protein [Shimia abyssi]|uniref:glycosyltransferase family 8 protein n=1 Tax=Shimia abyssi TaxID=1662395 RepID=UPI0013FDBA1F|nr:glycosyltransferase [Shimia abyssi]
MTVHPIAASKTGINNHKALAYCVDEKDLPFALFSASRAAAMSPNRDFDILICSLEPLKIPSALTDLGIKNQVLDLRKTLEQEKLSLGWLPVEAYLRLCLPDHLSTKYQRLVYLDTDTDPANADLSQLFDINLGPFVLGAVLDKTQWLSLEKPVLDFEERGIDCTKYFNSGVLLIDTKKWISQNVLQHLIDEKNRNPDYLFHDQSLLNLTFLGKIAELSPVWNWQWPNSFRRITRQVDPAILHYTGIIKPWHAAEKPSWYPQTIIEEFRGFVQRHNLNGQFQKPETGWVRYPLKTRIEYEVDQLIAGPRIRRLLARYPDPYKAIL